MLPPAGLGLLLLAGLGWVGTLLALTACGAAIVALVRAASWTDPGRADDTRSVLSADAAPSTAGEEA